MPTFCAYARAGNATGRPAFVNYCRLPDLTDAFAANPRALCSPDVIVLARHGFNSYGNKVRQIMAFCKQSANGTLPAGVVIYDDPADFVPPSGKVFPDGVGLPEDGISLRVATIARSSGGDVESPGLPAIGQLVMFLLFVWRLFSLPKPGFKPRTIRLGGGCQANRHSPARALFLFLVFFRRGSLQD